MAENDDVIFSVAFALRALMKVLLAEDPNRQQQMLTILAQMKTEATAPEIEKLVETAMTMVQSAV